MITENIVQKIWGLCHILRGDGVSYHEYISELTYLLFLKVAKENGSENNLPPGYRWDDLVAYDGDDLLGFYREMLTHLGGHASDDKIRSIYAFPTTVFSHSENLAAVVSGIAKIDWHSVGNDRMGEVYEGLLAKNSQDARSGAGQYFTPRPLVDCMVKLVAPRLGEIIQDPAMGTAGFLISVDDHIKTSVGKDEYARNPPSYEGVEIEKGTYRIAMMNAFLHRMKSRMILGDALTSDAAGLSPADVILANPPFGNKSGGARAMRGDIPVATSNKQLAFLQHIYLGLKCGGRAAVVLPDNVLFEGGAGRRIRQSLMKECRLHTVLRLPPGIFYSPGVQTNVLFFSRCEKGQPGTEETWFYDLRSDMPKFGRRRPLTAGDLAPFMRAYGEDPSGASARAEGLDVRWKRFTRDEIAAQDDRLNLSWLGDESSRSEDSFEPDEIAAAVLGHLRAAMGEIESLTAELSDLEEPRQ